MDFKKFLLIVFFIPCIAFAGKNEELEHFLNKLKYIPLADDCNNKYIAREFIKAPKNSYHVFLSCRDYHAFNDSFFDAWSNILNLNEEQRAHYFMVLIGADLISCAPTKDINCAITNGAKFRIINLMGQYFDLIIQNNVPINPKDEFLADLIIENAAKENILPIRLTYENDNIYYGLVLGDVYEIENFFSKMKQLQLVQELSCNNNSEKCRINFSIKNDDHTKFFKLDDLGQVLAKSLFSTNEEFTNKLIALFNNSEVMDTELDDCPLNNIFNGGMLSALKFFGIPININHHKILADTLVLGNMLKKVSARLIKRPFFDPNDVGLTGQKQIQKLFVNLIKLLRKKNSPFNFGENFPLELHSSLEESVLWFVEEDYMVNKVKHRVLMPYVILCNSVIETLERDLDIDLIIKNNKLDQSPEQNSTIFIADACGTIYLKDPHKEIDQSSSEENNSVFIADAFGAIYLQDPHKETELPK